MRSRPGDPDRQKKCTGPVGCRVTAMSTTAPSSTDPDHGPPRHGLPGDRYVMDRTPGATTRLPGSGRWARPAALAALLAVLLGGSCARAAAVPRMTEPSGDRSWPLAGRPLVVRGWEPPPGPYGPGHRGVDLAAPAGAPVLAAASGTVVFAGQVAGRGVLSVEVAGSGDPPLRFTYEPVRAQVGTGDEVTAGQPVAVAGPGPSHCAAGCLHWGLRRGDVYLDPLSLLPPSLLRRGPSRLLPVFGVPLPRPPAARRTAGHDMSGHDMSGHGSTRYGADGYRAVDHGTAGPWTPRHGTVAYGTAGYGPLAVLLTARSARGQAGLSPVRRAEPWPRRRRRPRRAAPRPARCGAPPRRRSPAAASRRASARRGPDRPGPRRS